MTVADHHAFMIPKKGGLHPSASFIPVVRDLAESLPETRAMFRLTESDAISESRASHFGPGHVALAGVWPVPDRFGGSSRPGQAYVNPNHVHAARYADAATRCECGAVVARVWRDPRSADEAVGTEHADDCKPQWRHRAYAEIHEKREAALRRLGPLGWDRRSFGPRFGCPGDDSVKRVPEKYGVSWMRMKDEYRRLAANTFELATSQGASTKAVAEAYGHAPNTLRRWVDEFGGSEPAMTTAVALDGGTP